MGRTIPDYPQNDTEEAVRNGRYEYFESGDGWHWNKIAGNGEITSSGEAHTTKGGCIAAIGRDMDDSSRYNIQERDPCIVEDEQMKNPHRPEVNY